MGRTSGARRAVAPAAVLTAAVAVAAVVAGSVAGPAGGSPGGGGLSGPGAGGGGSGRGGAPAPAVLSPAHTARSRSAGDRFVTIGAAPRLPRGAVAGPALAASAPLRLDVVLRPADPAALAAEAAAVVDPRSPSYHHYLSRGAFAARFAPPASEVAAVRAELAAAGVRLGRTSSDGLVVPLSGSAASLGRLLHTGFRSYRAASTGPADSVAATGAAATGAGFLATSAPALPASVAGAVSAVVGLSSAPLTPSDLVGGPTAPIGTTLGPLGDRTLDPVPLAGAARTPARAPGVLSPLPASPARTIPEQTGGAEPCATLLGDTAPQGPFAADQLAAHYGLAPLYQAGDLGQGETIALYELEAEPHLAADLAPFESCYGLPASAVTTEEVDGGPTGQGSQDPQPGLETDLDIEVAQELAPRSHIVVYQGPNAYTAATASGPFDTWLQIVQDDTAQVVSASWGECVDQSDEQLLAAENELFQQAAVQGQSVLAASGDLGACNSTSFTVMPTGSEDPASEPYVTAVGGTVLALPGAPPSTALASPGESAWGFGWGEASGGGTSVWPMPSWQQDTPSWLGVLSAQSSDVPCGAPAGSYCREYPDVSAVSVDESESGAYPIWYFDWSAGATALGAVGGTSGAAPLWAAIVALADAWTGCGGSPAGFVAPALYAVASSGDYGSAFGDVLGGTSANWPSVASPAGPGYDLASGLGTPVASVLVPALCSIAQGSTLPPVGPQLSGVSPGAALPGTSVTLAGSGLAGVTAVEFGSTPAPFQLLSPTSIETTVPAAVSGTVLLSVSGPGGTSVSYPFTAGVPVVDSVCSDGTCGSGSPSLIAGSGFDDAAAVDFGGLPSAGFAVVSDQEILALPPAQAPSGPVEVTVSDAAGSSAPGPGASYTLAAKSPPPISNFGYPGPPTFTVGSYASYTADCFIVGTAPTPTITESGAVPAGLSFRSGGGIATLSGTPSPGAGGLYWLTLSAGNGTGAPSTLSERVTVDEAPSIGLGAPEVEVADGGSVLVPVRVSGYPAPSLSVSGTLPPGVVLDAGAGEIAGASVDPGTYTVDVVASNGAGAPAEAPLTIVIDPPAGATTSTTSTTSTTAPALATTTTSPTTSTTTSPTTSTTTSTSTPASSSTTTVPVAPVTAAGAGGGSGTPAVTTAPPVPPPSPPALRSASPAPSTRARSAVMLVHGPRQVRAGTVATMVVRFRGRAAGAVSGSVTATSQRFTTLRLGDRLVRLRTAVVLARAAIRHGIAVLRVPVGSLGRGRHEILFTCRGRAPAALDLLVRRRLTVLAR